MTGVQLAALTGLLVAGGLVGIVWWVVPGVPALGAALDRLAAPDVRSVPTTATPTGDVQDRLGRWSERVLPARIWMTPTQDLALLRRVPSNFYGEKLLLAAIGLVSPPLIASLLGLLGFRLPFAIPVASSLVAMVVLFLLPNVSVRAQAKAARLQFNYALTGFIDLVALQRRAGSEARQALENAAGVATDNWVFARLATALTESGVDGRRPWEAFHSMATDLGLHELDDLANIMALAEQQSMPVYQTLREHNRALRVALLTDEQARANAVNERLTIPATLLVGVFVFIVLGPPLMTLLTS